MGLFSYSFLFIYLILVTAGTSEICSDSDFPGCLHRINSTQLCDESSSDREVNGNFSKLLLEMDLNTINEVTHVVVDHVNSMIFQLYVDMLIDNTCQSNGTFNNPEFFVLNRKYMISPLENSRLISSGLLYMLQSLNYLIAWKEYDLLTATENTLPPAGNSRSKINTIETPQRLAQEPFQTIIQFPSDFIEIHHENSIETIPRVTTNDIKWRGPFLKCNNGEFLRLVAELPVYALTNCSTESATRFTQVSKTLFEVPLSFIDFNQCQQSETIKLQNCTTNSLCQKREYSSVYRRDSYYCVCIHSYSSLNVTHYSDIQICNTCHLSCFNCTDANPCYTEVLRWALLTWNTMIMLICFCLIIITIIFSYIIKHESFVSSAPRFLLFILIGSFLMYTTLIVEFFPPSSVTCILSPWFFYPGFSLAFGSLIIKSWRIIKLYKVSKNWKHKTKQPSSIDWHLFLRLLPFIFITVISLSAWTVYDKGSRLPEPQDQRANFKYCEQTDWNYLIIVANLLLIVFGIILSIKARTLPSTYRETRDILFSIYNITIVNAMCTVVAHTLYFYQQDVNFVVLFVNLHLGISFMIFIMFRKKVTDVFFDKIVHKKRKHTARVNDNMLLMSPQERIRFIAENRKLMELVGVKEKRIKELQKECLELKNERNIGIIMEDMNESSDPEISPAIESTERQGYEMSTYVYEKRDSATESEINLELRTKHEEYIVSSPISTDL
ncbi:G-protein coupled receptor [Oopsacas minuta]|uniref:G-protein coupled receptor n=1 Tax=Oopsacas minuta TaxID=111878 RepID=A0AAV7JDA8_9METZ|nr:G-protein coupled receptor [Oopsacas minuta]